jgi:hypothetical protein
MLTFLNYLFCTKSSSLDVLNHDSILLIFSFLPLKDLYQMRRVSQKYKELAEKSIRISNQMYCLGVKQIQLFPNKFIKYVTRLKITYFIKLDSKNFKEK